jgi:hypothetical protein
MNRRNFTAAALTAPLLSGCDQKKESIQIMTNILPLQHSLNGKKIDIAEWTEEVLMHDGKTVVVWRRARAYSGGFPNASRGRDIDTEFKFEPMGINWTHEMSQTNLRHPVSFEIFDGVAFLVLYVGDAPDLFCADKPLNQYLAQFLKRSNGQWLEIPQEQFPADKALMNLSNGYWGHTSKDDSKGLIPWSGKSTHGEPGDTVKSYFEGFHRVCSFHQKKI